MSRSQRKAEDGSDSGFLRDDAEPPWSGQRAWWEDGYEERAEREKETRKDRYWAKAESTQEIDCRANSASYQAWSQACTKFFADPSQPFPQPPHSRCGRKGCIRGEKLAACHHDVEIMLSGSGLYSERWLKIQRLSWHPDKFSTRPEAREMAQELFQMIQRLIDGSNK
jgi:hypothetical protein